MSRWFLIMLALLLACVLWMGRYGITPVIGSGHSIGYAYRLDRFTGEVTVLAGPLEKPVYWSNK